MWKPSKPLPKSKWPFLRVCLSKKKRDLRKSEYKTSGQQQLSFFGNIVVPGDLKTVKNGGEGEFWIEIPSGRFIISPLQSGVCSLEKLFPSRPGSGCFAYL